MNYKNFVACIYLENQKAVRDFKDRKIIAEDPVALARHYCDSDMDALIVFDLSRGDQAHEEALGMIRKITEAVQIPVYGAGNIKRMEDVKKLLYAGCKKAILNFGKESSQEILKEVSQKFGQDKIAVSLASADEITFEMEQVDEFASEIILIDEHVLKTYMNLTELPLTVFLPEISLEKMLTILDKERVSGVSGCIVNENAKEIGALKTICKERGMQVHTFEASIPFGELKINSDGLVPVVVQEYKTNQVLMVAYMNEEAYNKTIKTGKMTYYSRSRKELWIKGLTSGHYQYVKKLSIDCDNDTLLARVSQVGAACHTGNFSCFYRDIVDQEETDLKNPLDIFEDVYRVIMDRKINPKEGSYTNYLFDKGVDKILKKLGEEATEIVIAAKNPDPEEIKYEISDFLYHMMVLMAEKNVTWEAITTELANR